MAAGRQPLPPLGERMKKFVLMLAISGCMAFPVFAEAEKVDGMEVLSSLLKAEQHFSNLEYDQAILIDEALLERVKSNAYKAAILMTLSSAYTEKGILAVEMNTDDPNFRKALDYSKECLNVDPTAWRALANQGLIYMKTGNTHLADIHFERAKQFANTESPYYMQMLSYHKYVRAMMEAEDKENAA